MQILGEAVYIDNKGNRHAVEGIGNLPDAALQNLNVSGTLSFGELSCDNITVEGEIGGKSLTAKKISVEGSFDVDAAEVETLNLSGSIDTDKLIAEKIFIESQSGNIGTIKCQQIKIFHGGNFFRRQRSRVRIKSIDAETVELENCAVDVIKCRDVVIGTNCAVEKLFVAGKCTVAADSTVGETIHT